MGYDAEWCYRVVQSRDPRFDGWFVTAVRTTGIYCRPSCPARTPKRGNVTFHPTAAAAQLAGYRACKRCRPDASPGSPEWRVRSDVVARAMVLIADGVVDRDGVGGLARRLGYSERHLNRLLVAELGAGPLALARSQRAQNARVLIETTTIPMVDVAFAAGFSSLRQFNDTVREVFAASPTELRASGSSRPPGRRRPDPSPGAALTLALRLPRRAPFAASDLWSYLGRRAVPGVEAGDGSVFRRALRLAHGDAVVELSAAPGHVDAVVRLVDVRDLTAAVARCRRLLDLDADPVVVDGHLAADPALAPLVAARPGLRCPGAVDGFEMAVRAVLGQQVSLVAGLRAVGELATRLGAASSVTSDGVDRTFPTAEAVAGVDPAHLPGPRSRATALVTVATAVATGAVDLGAGADRDEARRALLALSGVGPWTADYVALRALGDPDVLSAGDLVVRRRAAALGIDERSLVSRSARWAPWRSTVTHHLWAAPDPTTTTPTTTTPTTTPTPPRRRTP